MQGKSVFKAPNGKLLKIRINFNKRLQMINEIKIFGDFFLHPESGIEVLEKELAGKKLAEQELTASIKSILEKNSIQAYGFRPEDLAQAILLAGGTSK